MNDEEIFEQVAARLDDLEGAPIVTLSELVTREGACMSIPLSTEEPTWMGEKATDRELAAHLCAGCPVPDECLELEFRTAGFTTLGVWGALAEDDRRAAYLAWLQRRKNRSRRHGGVMPEHGAPLETEYGASLDTEPVSVHAPYLSYPDGQYRFEDAEERYAALREPLRGVALGVYDLRILQWLIGWDISVVAVVVSLLWRTRHAAAQESQNGGEAR
jgi:WhiB family transcriptional regulator, redox-sensing transcriptional regulator